MRITILGTGTLAEALGSRWVGAGHDITVAGRSPVKARQLAQRLAALPAQRLAAIRAVPLAESVADAEVVLLAVAYTGTEDVLRAVGAPSGSLSGRTVIDPVNAVEHGVGMLRLPPGMSHARRVAELAPGARVVKAFHLFPSEQWTTGETATVTVSICGDDPAALRTTEQLVRDVGAAATVFGGLDRARQLEEAAGFVISLAFSGVDPSRAVPAVP